MSLKTIQRLVCMLILLAGCGQNKPYALNIDDDTTGGATPEQATQNSLLMQQEANNATLISTSYFAGGAVVLYSKPIRNKPTLHYQVVWKNTTDDPWPWLAHRLQGSYGSLSTLYDDPDPLIEYDLRGAMPGYILYGRAIGPRAGVVEATFSNGDVLTDTIDSDVFSIFSPGGLNICEMRVLDHQGTPLRRVRYAGGITNKADLATEGVCKDPGPGPFVIGGP